MKTEEEIKKRIEAYKKCKKNTTIRTRFLEYQQKINLLNWVLEDSKKNE